MFNVHVRNTLFNFFQLQYTGTSDLKRRAIVEATADEDPGKRSVPGTGSVSTCTFAFFMHICFFYFKSSTRTFLHTKAQQLISPADRLLIKHIQFNSNTSSSYNCLDSYLKLFGFLLKCSVFERFPFS